MSEQLTLRLLDDDVRAFNAAAHILAGPSGARYVGRMEIVRRALAAFLASQPQTETAHG